MAIEPVEDFPQRYAGTGGALYLAIIVLGAIDLPPSLVPALGS
jgi:hypothetical protein